MEVKNSQVELGKKRFRSGTMVHRWEEWKNTKKPKSTGIQEQPSTTKKIINKDETYIHWSAWQKW